MNRRTATPASLRANTVPAAPLSVDRRIKKSLVAFTPAQHEQLQALAAEARTTLADYLHRLAVAHLDQHAAQSLAPFDVYRQALDRLPQE